MCSRPRARAHCFGHARAAEIQVSPGDDVEAAANALVPGDVLILADGTCELEGRFGATVVGTEDAPITIRAADGAQPHFNRATSDQNIVDFDVAEHVVIRGIEFSGGSAGVRFASARFVTFEDKRRRLGDRETAGGTGGIPADGDGDGGCGCTTDTPRAHGWLWLPLLVFARRRGA